MLFRSNFAAAIASRTSRVGVDIELVSPGIIRISGKFLNDQEKAVLQEWKDFSALHTQLVTVLWSAKEAIYKWYGEGKVDFKDHIRLDSNKIVINANETIRLPFVFCKHEPIKVTVEVRIFGSLVLAWLIT